MDERYEIRGKIGQGGLGAVYRAFDVRMNREVAVKRILLDSGDDSVSKEGTRQLIKEAGALASLQHPNIVTIYDIGTDKDGPFVVMELLAGHDLQDLIEKGSFTWPDFRQLAMQTLEALVAAQELHLVHRDLKPSNIMLTWLPSGKFQVKIVDFGLAKLSVKPSLQTIDQSDGVFGSIYFMAPEQFERVPIDLKCDLYAIGCVFYYALTGNYPFDGDHAAQVMVAHLQHFVEPLQNVREGIPVWACDWVMWLINRRPEDRPASAHEALMLFMSNDEYPNPELSIGTPAPAVIEQTKRPRLMIPGSAPVPEVVNEAAITTQSIKTASMPKPLARPAGLKPSVHTSLQGANTPEESAPNVAPQQVAIQPAAPIFSPAKPAATQPASPAIAFTGQPVANTPAAAPAPAPTTSILKRANTTPLLATSNSISKPKTLPTGKLLPTPSTAPTASVTPETAAPPTVAVALPTTKKKGLSSGLKMFIALVLGVLAVGLAFYYLNKSGENANTKIYNEMINLAATPGTTEIPVDKRKLDILLKSATNVAANENRDGIVMALFFAKSTDGTDVDAYISEFVTTTEMVPNIRIVLIREVLAKRKNPTIIAPLLKFARSTDDADAAQAAIQATRLIATDFHFKEFVDVILTTKSNSVIKAAEETCAEIIEKSKTKTSLREILITANESASNDDIRHAILRLMGRIGGDKALEFTKKMLTSDKPSDNVAAIVALGVWGDRAGFLALIEYLKSSKDLGMRGKAFDSALKYASSQETDIQANWTALASETKTKDEQLALIRALVNVPPAPWVYEILQKFVDSSDYEDSIDLAKRAIDRLKDIEKVEGGGEN